jgi:hypothetical protein
VIRLKPVPNSPLNDYRSCFLINLGLPIVSFYVMLTVRPLVSTNHLLHVAMAVEILPTISTCFIAPDTV